MHQCPNCAGNLKFDIHAQELLCEYCATKLNPYHFDNADGADEAEVFEATVYSCSSCGAELICDDTTVSTFCSYCGSSTFINSRISEEKRPKYIIPFSKTKDDCKKAYHKLLQKAFFAPDDLKNADYIEHFRGIYMPYWMYSFEKQGTAFIPGTTSNRSGDYIFTRHYDLGVNVDAHYEGIHYDASSAFCDNLSGAIAPFDITNSKPFSPSYLSGYYADTSDIDSSAYEGQARELAAVDAANQLVNDRNFRRFNVKADDLKQRLMPENEKAELALFPVWFLSYRNKDRVAYAVVNGQTGKAVSDLPIDIKKFLGATGVLAVILFILLNLFFTIKPTTLLWLSAALALLCGVISNVQVSRILYRENDVFRLRIKALEIKSGGKKSGSVPPAVIAFFAFFFCAAASFANVFIRQTIGSFYLVFVVYFIGFAVMFTLPFTTRAKKKKVVSNTPNIYRGNWKMKLPLMKKPLIGLAIAILIIIWNPVEDMFYYIGSLACIATMIWSFTDILQRHNVLTTRKLPQLNERGGAEYVQENI